jgi:hypothetical protein
MNSITCAHDLQMAPLLAALNGWRLLLSPFMWC